jgi:hypothetical protein
VRELAQIGSRPEEFIPFFEATDRKGSHGTLHYGSRKTTLKDLRKEISTGLLHAMLSQLGVSRRDLDD